jgi:hypothetical protein
MPYVQKNVALSSFKSLRITKIRNLKGEGCVSLCNYMGGPQLSDCQLSDN